MKTKFFREKNAKSIKNVEISKPKIDELLLLLNEKLDEKFRHIETIKNKNLRNEYLKKKNKFEQSLLMTEEEITSLLMERVCVDIFELITTIAKLKNISLNFKNKYDSLQIQDDKFDLQSNLNKLLLICKNYHFSLKFIEHQMNLVIEKEGSFENGLIVVYK